MHGSNKKFRFNVRISFSFKNKFSNFHTCFIFYQNFEVQKISFYLIFNYSDLKTARKLKVGKFGLIYSGLRPARINLVDLIKSSVRGTVKTLIHQPQLS